jgi:hypothetical protein
MCPLLSARPQKLLAFMRRRDHGMTPPPEVSHRMDFIKRQYGVFIRQGEDLKTDDKTQINRITRWCTGQGYYFTDSAQPAI